MKRFWILLLLVLSNLGRADQLVTANQGAAGSTPWPVTGTTLVQISQTLDAILAASGGGGDVNLTHIHDTSVANQSNAPGWMPSALGDGFGNPLLSSDSDFFGGRIFNVHDTGYSNINSDYVDVYSAVPGAWVDGPDTPGANQGIVTVTSLDAVGGVAVSPAQLASDIYSGNISTTGFTMPFMASMVAGITRDESLFNGVTVTYDGDSSDASNAFALDISNTLWGGVALAPAVDLLDANFDISGGFNSPAVYSLTAALNANGDTMASIRGGLFGSAPADDEYAMDVRAKSYAATLSRTDTFTATGDGVTQTFTAQNYTWQVRSDDPASIGLTFTIILENSIDGGTTWQTLDTKTEADVSSAPTTIAAKPGSVSRTRCSALNLGATATNVSGTVLAAM